LHYSCGERWDFVFMAGDPIFDSGGIILSE